MVLSIQRKQQHALKIYQITSLENGKVKKIIEYFLTHMGCVTKEFNLFRGLMKRSQTRYSGPFMLACIL